MSIFKSISPVSLNWGDDEEGHLLFAGAGIILVRGGDGVVTFHFHTYKPAMLVQATLMRDDGVVVTASRHLPGAIGEHSMVSDDELTSTANALWLDLTS